MIYPRSDGSVRAVLHTEATSGIARLYAQTNGVLLLVTAHGEVVTELRTQALTSGGMTSEVMRWSRAHETIPPSRFENVKYMFVRNRFCVWQVVFSRLEYVDKCVKEGDIRRETKTFITNLPSQVKSQAVAVARSFVLNGWKGQAIR
jgi:hypothetical protein